MSNVVALVPQSRSRLRSEAEAASVLLFTGVFQERYEDWSQSSWARRAATGQASRKKQGAASPASLPARTMAKSMSKSTGEPAPHPAGKQASGASVRRVAGKAAGASPAGQRAGGGTKARDEADPVIAAIIAKIAAQAVANADRVRKAAGRRNAGEPRARRSKTD